MTEAGGAAGIGVRRRAVWRRLGRLPLYAGATLACLRREFIPFWRRWRRVASEVRGWLRTQDAFLLYQLARRGPRDGEVVEIGSAWGRSTIALALGSRRARRETVLAIDPHTGDDWYLVEQGVERESSYDEFRRNIARFGLNEWVEPVVATSTDAASAMPVRPIRLLFIDGLHTYEGVRDDIEHWVPRVVPGGVIVFDDYDNDDPGVGVRRAVDELLASGEVETKLRKRFNLAWTRRV